MEEEKLNLNNSSVSNPYDALAPTSGSSTAREGASYFFLD